MKGLRFARNTVFKDRGEKNITHNPGWDRATHRRSNRADIKFPLKYSLDFLSNRKTIFVFLRNKNVSNGNHLASADKIQRNCPEAFVVLMSFIGLSLSFLSNKINVFIFSLL